MDFCEGHKDLVEMVREIHKAIMGDMTNVNSEGMRPMVMRHDRQLKGMERLKWIIISAIIGSMLTGITGVIYGSAIRHGQYISRIKQPISRSDNGDTERGVAENLIRSGGEVRDGTPKDAWRQNSNSEEVFNTRLKNRLADCD